MLTIVKPRRRYFTGCLNNNSLIVRQLKLIILYNSIMSTKVIYPGTFDPATLGHIDLIKRASRMFDETIIAVAENSHKQPWFSLEQRVDMLEQSVRDIPGAKVVGFKGLLIHFAEEQNVRVILRGLRAVSDFEFEFQLASMNRNLNQNIETIFLTPSEQHTFISSTIVKEVAKHNGDVSQFVSPYVLETIGKYLPVQNDL